MSSLLSDLTSGDPHLTTGERMVSVVLGLGLAAAAAKPRPNPLLNILALVGGSLLAYRGATGYCPVKAALADRRVRDYLPDRYVGEERMPEPYRDPGIPDRT